MRYRGLLSLAVVLLALAGSPPATAHSFNYCADQSAVFGDRHANVGITDGPVEAESPGMLDCSLGQMAAHHIGVLRGAIRWDGVETAPGIYQWGQVDGFVTVLAQHHITFFPGLIGAPQWLSTAPDSGAQQGYYPPKNPQQFGQFAALCVERYGPNGSFWRANPAVPYYPVRAWQIWNEPNLVENWEPAPDLQGYVNLLRAAYSAIKQVDTSATVVTAGMPFYTPAAEGQTLAQMYRDGAGGHFDVLAIHPYSATLSLAIQRVWAARRVMNHFGNARKPIWITEFGWAGGNPDAFLTNPAKQRTQILRFFTWVGKNRARTRLGLVVWYGWVDLSVQADPSYWGYHLGMFTAGFTPKPALSAMSSVAGRLDRCPVTQAVRLRGRRVICGSARSRRRA